MLVNCVDCGYPAYFSTTAVQRGDACECQKCGVAFRADATGRPIRLSEPPPAQPSEPATEQPEPHEASLTTHESEPLEASLDELEPEPLGFLATEPSTTAAPEPGPLPPASIEPPVKPIATPVEPDQIAAPVEPSAAPIEPIAAPDEPAVEPIEPEQAPVEPGLAPIGPSAAALPTAVSPLTPLPLPAPETEPPVVSRAEPTQLAQPAVLPAELGVPDDCPHVAIDVVFSLPGETGDRLCRTARLDETFVLLATDNPMPRILPGGSFVLESGPISVEIRPEPRFVDTVGLVPARYAIVEPQARDLVDELLAAVRQHGGWWVACPTCARGQPVAQGTLEGQLVLTTCQCGTTAAIGPQGVVIDLDACPSCGATEPAATVRRASGNASMPCAECGTRLVKDTHGRVIARPKGEPGPDAVARAVDGCPTCGRTSEVLFLRGSNEGTQTPCLGCGTILSHEDGHIVALVPAAEVVEPDVLAALGLVESVPRAAAEKASLERATADHFAHARAAAERAAAGELAARIDAAEKAAAERAAEARAAAERAAAEKVAAEKAASEKAIADAVAAAKAAAERAAADKAAAEQASALKAAAEAEAQKAVEARIAAEAEAKRAMAEATAQRNASERAIAEAAAAQAEARKAADEAKAIKTEAERVMAEAATRRVTAERETADKAAAAEAAATMAASEATAAREAAERVAAEQEAVRRVTAEQTAVIQAAVEHVAAQTALARVTQRINPISGVPESYQIVPVSPAEAAAPELDLAAARPARVGWLVAILVGSVIGCGAALIARGGLPMRNPALDKLEQANTMVREGDPAGAITLLAEVIAEAPELDTAYRHLGVAYALTGNADEARAAYRIYVERATDREDADLVQALLGGED